MDSDQPSDLVAESTFTVNHLIQTPLGVVPGQVDVSATIGQIPPHSHGEQWGIVVQGEMDLTVGGETKRYRAGDSYHIPAGVEHGATFLTHFRAIDVFADVDRCKAKG